MASITELKASLLTSVEELREILKTDDDGLIPATLFETFDKITPLVKDLKKACKKGKKSGSESEDAKEKKVKARKPKQKKEESDDDATSAEKKPAPSCGGFKGASKPKKEKKVKKDEDKPKRPPSRYNLFMKEKMAELKAEDEKNGEKRGSQDLMRIVVEMWNSGAKESYKKEEEDNSE